MFITKFTGSFSETVPRGTKGKKMSLQQLRPRNTTSMSNDGFEGFFREKKNHKKLQFFMQSSLISDVYEKRGDLYAYPGNETL